MTGCAWDKESWLIRPRVVSITSSATPTPNIDICDMYLVTALAAGATFGAPTGAVWEGRKLIIRIKDNATLRSLAWNAIYREGSIALPTTTVASETIYCGFMYNAVDVKWDLVAYVDGV